MKAAFIGGGSLRVLGILRGALAEREIFDGGEICLYDLDKTRADAMRQMILKTPEYRNVRCRVTSASSLGKALDGADMVGVILMAGSQKTFQQGAEACWRRRFIPSDNLSPNGAFLAIKGAPILMNIASEMSRRCPAAWLVDFANPVAVLSGMINNHTKIKTLGVCAGYTNHQWDLSRILGKDEQGTDFDVETVGINHLSYIVKGTSGGKELFAALDRHLANGWRMPKLQPSWSAAFQKSIPRGIRALVKIYREMGVLVFSTEGDGMIHLDYEAAIRRGLKTFRPSSPGQIRKKLSEIQKSRRRADRRFRGFIDRQIPEPFWIDGWRQPGLEWARRQDRDIFVEVMRGLSGVKKVKVVTSRRNDGAVKELSDRTVLEYSQIIDRGRIRAAGVYKIPAAVRKITCELARHQTELGDALAANDPKMLAGALLRYPVCRNSKDARRLFEELSAINRDEMPEPLRRVGEFF